MNKSRFFASGAILFIWGYGFCLILNEPIENKSSLHFPNDISNALTECKSENSKLAKRIDEITSSNNLVPNKAKGFAQTENVASAKTTREKRDLVSTENDSAKNSELQTLSHYMLENELKKHKEFPGSIHVTQDNLPQALNDNYKKDIVDIT